MPLTTDIGFAADPLRTLLGADAVCTDPAEMAPYLRDERGAFLGQAGLMVRPATAGDVSRLLRYCVDNAIAVVPQGGNTGYCGGGTPFSPSQLLLRLDRLNRVRSVNRANYSMTLEAGVILQQAQEAAQDAGLDFPLSMGSQGSCQIGGVLSTNAGGLNAVRFGVARDFVLGLEVVLPDGRLLSRTRGLRKDNTGYRVTDLFIGAEGTLGVITAASLKLLPRLAGRATALLCFAGTAAACDGLLHFREACDDNLVSYELLSRGSVELACATAPPGLPSLAEDAVMVLLEVAAARDERAAELLEAALAPAIEGGLVTDGTIAASLDQRAGLWRFREGIPEAEKRAGGSLKHDVSVPVQDIDAFLADACAAVTAIADARFSIFGHLGDGNLHFNVLAPVTAEGAAWREQFGDAITGAVLELAESYGGSFSAEHGIGSLKVRELARYRPEELAVMRALKATLDPAGIMNPGKVLV